MDQNLCLCVFENLFYPLLLDLCISCVTSELRYKWKGVNDVQLYSLYLWGLSKRVSFQERVSWLKVRCLFVWLVKDVLYVDS